MDLITHCVLGASIGYAILGQRSEKKALIVGAIGGMLPDIDVVLTPFANPVEMLFLHRSYTHSLFFIFLAAPLFGYLTYRVMKNTPITIYQWTSLFFWVTITHPILDLFTAFGTGLLLPFDDGRYSLATISVIDFFFTAPLLLSACIVFFFKKISLRYKQIINISALSLSILYLGITIINKAHVNTIFEENLYKQQKKHAQLKAYPLFGSNIRWTMVAKTDGGFWIGNYALTQTKSIEFSYISKNDYLILDYEKEPNVRSLKRFCKGMYAFEKTANGDIIYNDLRYGFISQNTKKYFLFSYRLRPSKSGLQILSNNKISLLVRLKH